jgi:hypothetical protein
MLPLFLPFVAHFAHGAIAVGSYNLNQHADPPGP